MSTIEYILRNSFILNDYLHPGMFYSSLDLYFLRKSFASTGQWSLCGTGLSSRQLDLKGQNLLGSSIWCYNLINNYNNLPIKLYLLQSLQEKWKKEWASSHTPRSNIAWECSIQWMAIPSIRDRQSDKKGDINCSSKGSNQHFL